MNIEELRNFCTALPGVTETLPFDEVTLVFKVAGKMFLLTGLDASELQFNVKCDPEKAIALREQYDCVRPGYHMNKQHWNTVHADGSVSDRLLEEWILHSYDAVIASLPAKTRRAFFEDPSVYSSGESDPGTEKKRKFGDKVRKKKA